jgi:hypothetical protein
MTLVNVVLAVAVLVLAASCWHLNQRLAEATSMTEPEDKRFSYRVESDQDGRFDEIVVGNPPWIHLECMGCHDELPDGSENRDGAMSWRARIGDAQLWVTVPRKGEPTLDVTRGYHDTPIRGSTAMLNALGEYVELAPP